ncbi:MAG: ribbon-helix-helix domain-containing protein [Gaiellaceae bacterium MAG52_C11]|nr:ribbon-helix-helix domain-containing protein [Candidatus Gaiellasilicea maunaloa]
MIKTTVYLPEELKARLERTAASRGQSEADVIRAALDQFTVERERPRPHLPLVQSFGEPGLSERVDEELARGFGRD